MAARSMVQKLKEECLDKPLKVFKRSTIPIDAIVVTQRAIRSELVKSTIDSDARVESRVRTEDGTEVKDYYLHLPYEHVCVLDDTACNTKDPADSEIPVENIREVFIIHPSTSAGQE